MHATLRSADLARLEEYSAEQAAHFVVVHGQRRVGKSVLLAQFLKGKHGVYFEASQDADPVAERRRFLADAFAQLGLGEAAVTANDWLSAISLVFKLAPASHRFVLCLDEFPWLVAQSPDALSLLKQFWDRHQHDSRLLLILCGSDTAALKRYFAGSAPAMGRRTRNLEITPLSLRGISSFLPQYGHQELALAYFLCGGYPGYLKQLDPSVSMRRNIERTFLRDDHVFAREADFLLREEQMADVPVYVQLLRSVAAGRHRLSEIESVGETQRARSVQQLVGLGLLEKRLPVGGSTARPKYYLTNPVLCFGLRFGPQVQSFLRLLPPADLFARIQPDLAGYWGRRWEECVLSHLPELLATDGLSDVRALGSYWDDAKGVQLDVVVQESKSRWQFGECKWGPTTAAPALEQLRAAAARHPAAKAGITQTLRLFSIEKLSAKSRTAKRDSEAVFTGVEDLLALPASSLAPR